MNIRALLSDLPIIFTDVSISVGPVTILDSVDLKFSTGAATALIGANGSGKTTLLRAAMGLLPPTSGRITWGGREHVPPSRRAFVFQRPVMLRRSAAANLRYALGAAGILRDIREARIDELLSLVGLPGLGARAARKMSGGEQQRLAIARALARDPAVLFLDEPTAGLDPASAKTIEDVIRTVAHRGIKVIMATHNLGEAKRLAGEVVLLHRGRVAEKSDAAVFFGSPKTDAGKAFIAGGLLV